MLDNKIVHLTSVHARYDTRIYLKECRSLKAAGYSVSLVVADGLGDEVKDGIPIYDVGVPSGRLNRMFRVTKRVLTKAEELNADVYHFHDPELIPVGLKLKRLGKKVIFDAHEDLPKQLLSKPYLPKLARLFLSKLFGAYEIWACKRIDVVIAATPFICDKFVKINANTVNINNFPLLGELSSGDINYSQQQNQICYVGGISGIRGIREVVLAMEQVSSDVRLQLVGSFSEKDVEAQTKAFDGWGKVDELGFVNRAGVRDVLGRCIAGLVTFHPLPNHVDAQPNKMFEYMSAGIPVIASNFPLWRDIIVGNDCGLCVDPMDPTAIAEAIDFFVVNSVKAKLMGKNGQKSVQERYNWEIEERKLISLYASLSA